MPTRAEAGLTDSLGRPSYIGIPVFVIMWIGWKVVKKTSFIRASDMDFSSARRFDALDDDEDEETKVPIWKRTMQRFRKAEP